MKVQGTITLSEPGRHSAATVAGIMTASPSICTGPGELRCMVMRRPRIERISGLRSIPFVNSRRPVSAREL